MAHIIDLMPRLAMRLECVVPPKHRQPDRPVEVAAEPLPDFSNVLALLPDHEQRRLQLLECCGCR